MSNNDDKVGRIEGDQLLNDWTPDNLSPIFALRMICDEIFILGLNHIT